MLKRGPTKQKKRNFKLIPTFSVQDKIAIVTGGLGQLGTQFTKQLAGAGAKVAIYARRARTEAEIEAQFPGLSRQVRVLVADVRDKDSLIAATDALIAEWGVPDILVNNAGIDSKPDGDADQNAPFEDYPKKYWDDIIETNLTGCMLTSQVVGTKMADAGKGSIIMVGSVSPNQALYAYREERDGKPFVKAISYAASKAGLLNMTRYLATYWAKKGVRVNLVTFGGVKTGSFDKEFIDAFLERVPMGRQANIEEFGPIVQFLGSDASSYMPGANLVLDGGFTAW